jgi:23S rRNA (adenine2503-C2)-methyltransferase
MKRHFLDVKPKEIKEYLESLGHGAYRLGQILEWVYKRNITDFKDFANLPADLRKKLAEDFVLRIFKLKKKSVSGFDGTIRFDFETSDGHIVSAVYLPQNGRNVVCISTQIGCVIGCKFCNSGKRRFVRNLTRGEILEQILSVQKDVVQKLDGVLFMGMGEPLLNLENVVSAIKSITDLKQIGIGRRHVVVSTVGFIEQIRKLRDEKLGVRLAISLHAPDDEIRSRFIPGIVPYTVEEILKEAIGYSRANKTALTIEYILISGQNDTLLSARKVVKLIRDNTVNFDKIQINLIPYNPTEKTKLSCPDRIKIDSFRSFLVKSKLLAIVREPRGLDIGSACGQLGV